jgi:hypothetical protein
MKEQRVVFVLEELTLFDVTPIDVAELELVVFLELEALVILEVAEELEVEELFVTFEVKLLVDVLLVVLELSDGGGRMRFKVKEPIRDYRLPAVPIYIINWVPFKLVSLV